jgi:hypothetical protein
MMQFYPTCLLQLYTDSTHFGILIEGPFGMSFRADVDPFGSPPLRLSVEGLTIGRSTHKIVFIR